MPFDNTNTHLSKSDFLLYLDAPLHLWAAKHGQADLTPSEFDQHMMRQGYEVESLAKAWLEGYALQAAQGEVLLWQNTYEDGQFIVRTDELVYRPGSDCYDLYEIKSSTSLSKDHLYDITYQLLVLESSLRSSGSFCYTLTGTMSVVQS